jgi:NAD(P)H-dependent FMN reductase
MAPSDPSTPREREPVRFLVFCASMRAESLNGRLARLAQATHKAFDEPEPRRRAGLGLPLPPAAHDGRARTQ